MLLVCSAKGISSEADITEWPQAPREDSMIHRPGWKWGCRAVSPSLWAPYWAEVFVKGTNSQPLAVSNICLSHGDCQKRMAVSVKLQIILHKAMLITLKVMAGLELFYFFLNFFFLCCSRQHFVLRPVWLAQCHSCITLLQFYKKFQQVP